MEPAVENNDHTPSSEAVEIFLPSILGYEKIARTAAEAVAEEMGFSPDRVEDLKTAVSEACMNAIEHGNQEDKAVAVTVLLTAAPHQLEVKVADKGLSPMPDELPAPGRPEENFRGWGMFFITRLVDEVEITRLPGGGNQVKMVIYLTPPEGKVQAETDSAEGQTSDG